MMVPLARAVVDADNPSYMKSRDNELQYGGKPTAEQLRKRKKAVTLEEGPRSPQMTLLILLWIGAGFVGLIRFGDPYSQSKRLPWTRQLSVRTTGNTSRETVITRDVDVAFCQVYSEKLSPVDISLWILLVGIPLIFGPVLTGFLEIFFQLKRCLSRPPHPPVPRRRGLWIFLFLVSASIFCSYTTNLILSAAILPTYFKLTYFQLLLIKYVGGWMDIFTFPIFVIMTDKNIRNSIVIVYTLRQSKRIRKGSNGTITYV
ncbi:uncharacterized protein LOC111694757 [Eurytemora carolleeae]|uniref:uncharacterized protein LOC111694757 n=1 Tax=Eurytemora carolleeae TaxID=1294199 RepID=UPI000C7842AC|nr:uncharacterized protein LOC111694757 [Eurytemora carolleeae]|eukprot:XP_023319532.1 uncharacterized protein LOC111694757 [Eurytemora affinis]